MQNIGCSDGLLSVSGVEIASTAISSIMCPPETGEDHVWILVHRPRGMVTLTVTTGQSIPIPTRHKIYTPLHLRDQEITFVVVDLLNTYET